MNPVTSRPSAAAQALLESRAQEAERRSSGIRRIADSDASPLSHVQQMVWLSTQLDKRTTAYNRCSAMRISGNPDCAALQRAISEIARRHPVLRSRVDASGGTPMMRVLDLAVVSLSVMDLSALPPAFRAERVEELLDAEARMPFDLDRGPMIRAGLLKEDDHTHTLFISTHHIATDGWSDGVMLRELNVLYSAFVAGNPSPLPDPAPRYVDFVAWQNERIEGIEGERNSAYWQDQMEGAPLVQELPADYARADAPSMAGRQVRAPLSSDLSRALDAIGRSERATPAMTMLAAFLLFQSRITGQADTVTGLSLAGRNHAGVENLIGLFNCVLPLRVNVDAEITFRELLGRVRTASLEAHEHQDVPVTAILEASAVKHGVRHAEIAQTVFNFRNMPAFEPALSGLDVRQMETFNGSSVAELELEVLEERHGWECVLRFRTDRFEERTAARLLGHYVTLLESVAATPDELCSRLRLLTDDERRQILFDFRCPVKEYAGPWHLHELMSEQARKTPLAVAVTAEGGELTYAELETRSTAFARELISRGSGPGTRVGVCMERSLEMIVTLFAILKSGAAFVPLDTDYPIDRLAHMLRDTSPVLLIADARGAALLGSRGVETLIVGSGRFDDLPLDTQPLAVEVDERAPACVLYTSGSTGLPKGVLSTHRGIANNLRAMQDIFSLSSDDCMLQQTSLGFDAAAWEIFWPLSVGARTYVARPGGQRDASYVIEVVARERIGLIGFAPSMIKVMADMPGFTENRGIRRVMSYGEVLPTRLQDTLFERMPHVELYNLYGPTETSITVTSWKCDRASTRLAVPIGRPLPNSEIYILDPALEPVPIGVGGEIFIGGVAVSAGYHDRPELTAERFPPHPLRAETGDRVYRTGDIARFDSDGVIEFIGRRDHQLKIRGLRVELEEIEAALSQLPGVRESVVVVTADSDGEHRLIAYVAVDEGAESPLDMRRGLERRLPPQFLPAQIIQLDSLPHGPNGKVERRRLPDPAEVISAPVPALEPRTALERKIADVWQELLHITSVGITDSFFELGGHSLLAVRMLQRVSDETATSMTLRSFYEEPTIDAMTRFAATGATQRADERIPPLLKVRPGANDAPALFYINGQPVGGGKYARRFVSYLPDNVGLYVVPVPIFGTAITVEGVASRIIEQIRIEQPAGPYLIGGNCFGATLALEIAHRLRRAGEDVSLVVLVHPDARAPMHFGFRAMRRAILLAGIDEKFTFAKFDGPWNFVVRSIKEMWKEQRRATGRLRRDRIVSAGRWFMGFARKHVRRPAETLAMFRRREAREGDVLVQNEGRPGFADVFQHAGDHGPQAESAAHARYMSDAWTAYAPKPYEGRVAIVWPIEGPANPPWNPRALWDRLTPDLDWRFVPGNHWTMLHEQFEHSARAIGEAIVEGKRNA